MKIHQLLRDNAGREKRPANVIRNGADASLYIYDVIDAYWGVSALSVIDALAQAQGADVLNVYINSPGGDVFEGRAIMAAIRRFDGKTVAHIDSLCASAATSIALACDEVEMSDGAFFMIHNASGLAWGDKTDHREVADLLEKVEGAIVDDYTKKTGKTAEQIAAWMNEETWFTAQEALDEGFIDRLATSSAKTKNTWNLASFGNAPPHLKAPDPDPPEAPVELQDKPASAGFFHVRSEHESPAACPDCLAPLAHDKPKGAGCPRLSERNAMTNIQALREKISNLATQAKNLLADKGDQTWTAEEQTKFDNLADEIERAKGQIKAEERMRELDADKFFENVANQPGIKREDNIDALAAVALYLRHGHNVTAEQAIAIRNAMSTTTTTEGGHTVPTEVAAMVIESMKAFGGMRELAQVITTDGGNPLNFPTSDGTSEVGEIVAENAAATSGDITFGVAAVNPYMYSSKKIALPWQLISDSAIDVIGLVTKRLGERLGRITNTHHTVGTGSSQPFGVIARAATGKTGTTGQTLTVIYDDLFDLKHSVNRAYRRNAKWMMNDLSVAIVSKLKETTGRPIWEPSILAGSPDRLLGFEVVTNDDVAVMAANAKSIAFGDFSKFVIRDIAGSMQLRRFDDSAFALNGQVGFCGWMRTGSNLLDTAAVKLYVNSAT